MASKLGLVIVLVLLASASASGSTAHGSSPFPAGWIVTVITAQDPGGFVHADLFRIRTDGTGLHRLTHSRRDESDPSFAPNGRRVVFSQQRRGIFTIGIDGSGLRQLTPYGAGGEHPVYSPDGKRIAFIRSSRLWVMQSDGSRQRLLRRAPLVGFRPSWSPDGRKIVVFAGEFASESLYTLSGRTGRVLKRTLLMDGDLAMGFSGGLLAPDGRTVVFEAYRPTPPDCKGFGCDEVYALYRRPLARGIASTRVVCNDCSAEAWSADSRVLLIARLNGRLELRVVRDGRTKLVGPRLGGEATLQPR